MSNNHQQLLRSSSRRLASLPPFSSINLVNNLLLQSGSRQLKLRQKFNRKNSQRICRLTKHLYDNPNVSKFLRQL
jgi:hypothetical protein